MFTGRLKHGKLLVFEGANWRLAGDARWKEQFGYVPNYFEKPVGTRRIGGIEHAVFQVLTGDFAAQPLEAVHRRLPEEPSLRDSPPKKDIARPRRGEDSIGEDEQKRVRQDALRTHRRTKKERKRLRKRRP